MCYPLMAPRPDKIPPAFVAAKYCVASILVFCVPFVHAQGVITTIAGGGQFQFTGVGGPATNAPLGRTAGITTDPQGNVYAADQDNHIVVKIAPTGLLTIVAGNGTVGYSGDGGPATEASFIGPVAVAADGAGNIFVLDYGVPPALPAGVCVVRKVIGDGTISTFAGIGACGFSGDGGAATQAAIYAQGISVDSKGNLYIADSGNGRVRKYRRKASSPRSPATAGAAIPATASRRPIPP
jgi:trimeric autotransporter adhesin